MSPFDAPPPAFDATQLASFAEEHFGIRGSVAPLPGERDQNGLLTATSGDRYVLKVANVNEDPDQLAFQNAALLHLAARDPGLGTPRVCPTRGTGTIAEVSGPGGAVYCVRLLSYLPGRTLKDVAKSPALLRDLGAFMGRLDRALQGFTHDAAARPDFLWNLDRALACRPLAAAIDAADDRALVEQVFARHAEAVAPRLVGLRCAVIHQDANDHNVLTALNGSPQVVGLIDFGDMVWGRQINELAVTLAYALLGVEDPSAAAAPVITGYHTALPLQETELSVLLDLVALRLATSVCISSARSKEHPDNPYLLVSQQPAFALLRALERAGPPPYSLDSISQHP